MKRYLLGMMWPMLSACIPDVYLIDRQTVLELEASGEWPELDRKFQTESLQAGPLPLEQTRDRIEERQIFSMTHADQEKTDQQSTAPKP
ncbi:MAG: hypothetical protein ACOVS5_14665 [Oligoflexus sp.]|jgi:hypothetical protein